MTELCETTVHGATLRTRSRSDGFCGQEQGSRPLPTLKNTGGSGETRYPQFANLFSASHSPAQQHAELLACYFVTSPTYTVYGASEIPPSACVSPALAVVNSVLACLAPNPSADTSTPTACPPVAQILHPHPRHNLPTHPPPPAPPVPLPAENPIPHSRRSRSRQRSRRRVA